MLHQTNHRFRVLAIGLLLLVLFVTAATARSQDPPSPIFGIHPANGQFYASALYGNTEPGTVQLFFNDEYLGEFFIPPLTHALGTVLTVVDISNGIHSFEVRGDFTYYWSDTDNGPPLTSDPPPLPTTETVDNTPPVERTMSLEIVDEPTPLELWAHSQKPRTVLDPLSLRGLLE